MRVKSLASVVGLACLSATAGSAQEVLPEIAVSAPAPTAGTSGDGLQRGPVSVIDDTYQSSSAITGREIQRSNAASLADLLSGLPGVSAFAVAHAATGYALSLFAVVHIYLGTTGETPFALLPIP